MGPLGAFTLQLELELDPSPPCRAGLGRGGEVALVSSLAGKAETLIHSALALGDSAALPSAPRRAQHQDPPQLHPKAKPGGHSLGLLCPPPALSPQMGSQDPQERGDIPLLHPPWRASPLHSPAVWGCSPAMLGKFDCSAFQIYIAPFKTHILDHFLTLKA